MKTALTVISNVTMWVASFLLGHAFRHIVMGEATAMWVMIAMVNTLSIVISLRNLRMLRDR